ncbi:MAG: 50S ribosomal protein L29 [Halobacteriaceae archaeon]
MNYDEIRQLSEEERAEELKQARLELIELNAQVATGTPPENPGRIQELRKTIARMKTADHD